MSRNLLMPLLGACALLASQALVRGQNYAPTYPVNYPAPAFAPPTYPSATPVTAPTNSPAAMPPQQPNNAGQPANLSPVAAPTPPAGGEVNSPSSSGNQPVTSAPLAPSQPGGWTFEGAPAPGMGMMPPGEGDGSWSSLVRCRPENADGPPRINVPRALPTIGGYFGVRYNRAILVPVNRTVSYSLLNSNPAAAATVGLTPVTSLGVRLNTLVSVDGGPGVQLAPGVVTPVTLNPGGTAVVTANGIVNSQTSVVDYAGRAQILASDYESVRPVDRAYVSGSHFNNVSDRLTQVVGPTRVVQDMPLPQGIPEVSTSLVAGSNTFFDAGIRDLTNTQILRERGQMTRGLIGFEKTVELGGIDGSFGMRLPFFEVTGSTTEIRDVGDLSLNWKAVVYGGFDTEDLITVGLVLTLPTGPKLITPQGEITSVLIQPWVGYYYTLKHAYLQGFTGVVIPTESRDTGFSYTNLALGYRFYESCKCKPFISLVAGQLEAQVLTPFERQSLGKPIVINDSFVGTAAVHVGFGDSGLLTLGFGVPVGGYRPYEYQGTAGFSVLF